MECKRCGCTDSDCRVCVEAQGYPCSWVAPGKCSRCYSVSLVGAQEAFRREMEKLGATVKFGGG